MNENILEKIDNISKSVKPIDDDKYQKAEIMLRSHSGHYITQQFCSASDIVSTINSMVNKQIDCSFDFSYEPIRINDNSLDSQIKETHYQELSSSLFHSYNEENRADNHKKEKIKDVGVFFIRKFTFNDQKNKDNTEAYNLLLQETEDIFNLISKHYNVTLNLIFFLIKKSKLDRGFNLDSKYSFLQSNNIYGQIEYLHSIHKIVSDYKQAIEPKEEYK